MAYEAMEGIVEELHDIAAFDVGAGKALGPVDELAAVDAELLDGEGEGEAELEMIALDALLGQECVDARGKKVKQLKETI